MKKKFFVVSPPRSGTKSLTRMAKLCGLTYKHSPVRNLYSSIDEYDFFSDTPVYCLSHIKKICEYTHFQPCFIYIQKDPTRLFLSWKNNLILGYYTKWFNSDFNTLNENDKFDLSCYKELFNNSLLSETNCKELFDAHKNGIIDFLKEKSYPLLEYNFSSGWDPFCSFIGRPCLNQPIPHINKNTLYEQI